MNFRSTDRINRSILPGVSGFLESSTEFVGTPFQKMRRRVDPLVEHSTAQSVCPGFANSPRITLDFRLVYGCGIVHPRRSSSGSKFFGSSGNAVGGSRFIG